MLLLLVSCLLGIWVGMHGETQIDQGLDPTRLGAAGVPKFPHGVVIHAVQWLPVLAWSAAGGHRHSHPRVARSDGIGGIDALSDLRSGPDGARPLTV